MKILIILLVFIILPLLMVTLPTGTRDWRTADRSSVGIAPLATDEQEALVHVYAARAYDWRGRVAVHSWIATKTKKASFYTVYQVIGFNQKRKLPVVSITKDLPDRKWYDNAPELLLEVKGRDAERMIPQIQKAAQVYPYQDFYRLWPGPNSNSFIAYIMRHTSGFGVELPPHAIGKDWLENGKIFARSQTGTGFQISLYGVLGITLGWAEGIEINILGLTYGVDIMSPALKLPFIGRIGVKDRPTFNTKEVMNAHSKKA